MPLNSTGEMQAKAVAQEISNKYPEAKAIYSSPLKRAHQTASAIANAFEQKVILVSDLSESSIGALEGMLISDFKEEYRETIKDFHQKYPTPEERREHSFLPDLETINALESRIKGALLAISSEHPDETVVVVSHSRAIRAFLSGIEGCDIESLSIPNCFVTVVTYEPDLDSGLKIIHE